MDATSTYTSSYGIVYYAHDLYQYGNGFVVYEKYYNPSNGGYTTYFSYSDAYGGLTSDTNTYYAATHSTLSIYRTEYAYMGGTDDYYDYISTARTSPYYAYYRQDNQHITYNEVYDSYSLQYVNSYGDYQSFSGSYYKAFGGYYGYY